MENTKMNLYLLGRVFINILLAVIFWIFFWTYISIPINNFFKYLFQSVPGETSFVLKAINQAVPLCFGVITGIIYYFLKRINEKKISEQILSNEEISQKYPLFLKILHFVFGIYFIGLIVLSIFISRGAIFGSELAGGYLFTTFGSPAIVIYILIVAFSKKPPSANFKTYPQLNSLSYIIGVGTILLVTILSLFYIFRVNNLITEAPKSTNISDLIASSSKYQNLFVATGTDVLYHVKGLDGFAVGYYNLYNVSNEVQDYIWLDKGVIPEFSFAGRDLGQSWAQEAIESCNKGLTAEELRLRVDSLFGADKLIVSIEEFSKYYQIPEESITAYMCTGYDIMGKFIDRNSAGGPNNKFHFIIKPNENKFDEEKFKSELNINQQNRKVFQVKVE